MNRRVESKTCLFLGVAALAGFFAFAAPVASAATPAGDEYTLDLPGVGDGNVRGGGLVQAVDPPALKVQAGVAGESTASRSPLSSTGAALSAAPVGVALALLALTWMLLGFRLRSQQAE